MQVFIELKDYLLLPFYLLLIFFLIKRFAKNKIDDPQLKKYYVNGALLKLFGGFLFAMMYQYYYHGGDTAGYFWGGKAYNILLFENPGALWQQLNINEELDITSKALYASNNGSIDLAILGDSTYYMLKAMLVINFLGLNAYLPCTLLIAYFSFLSTWKLMQAFVRINPNFKKYYFYALFLSPNLLIWGSAINKDTICLICVNLIFYYAADMLYHRKLKILNLIIIYIATLFLFKIKIYIAIAFIPALMLYVVLELSSKIKNKLLRKLSLPLLFIALLPLVGIANEKITEEFSAYALENVLATAKGTGQYIFGTGDADAAYSIGDIDLDNPIANLKLAPAAINVTLFRPYPWEAKKAIILFSAIESFAILLLTIYALLKSKIIFFFTTIWKHNYLILCFVFSMVFAIAVGASTFNFGSLVRYKVPCLPFFLVLIFCTLGELQLEQKAKKAFTSKT